MKTLTEFAILLVAIFLLCDALDIAVTNTADGASGETQFSSEETKAIEFLQRYGYLPTRMRLSRIPLTRALFTNAMNNYQVMADLAISERLDDDTLSSMGAPRCGNADVRRGETGVARYEILGPRWRKGNLTYRISLYPTGNSHLTRSVVDASLKKAMNMWSNVSRIDFIPVEGSRRAADIDIRFERSSYDSSCNMYFQMGELAHATMTRSPAKVHFNGRVGWKVGLARDASAVDLVSVAAHEIGHVLGLDHSPDRRALMFAKYRGASSGLGRDDVLAIQSLYGARKPGGQRPQPEQEPEKEPAPGRGVCPSKVTPKMPDGKRQLCAVVYTERLCGGNRLPIEAGNKTRQLNDGWDNEIASAEVNPSCTLKVCHRRSFIGGCIDLEGGEAGQNFNRMPLGYNSMITSLTCVCDEENTEPSPTTSPSAEPEGRPTLQQGREPPPYIPNTDNARTCAVLVQSWEPGAARAWVEEESALRMPPSLLGVTYTYVATRRGCSLYYCTRPAFAGICEMMGPSRHATSDESFKVGSLFCECQ